MHWTSFEKTDADGSSLGAGLNKERMYFCSISEQRNSFPVQAESPSFGGRMADPFQAR